MTTQKNLWCFIAACAMALWAINAITRPQIELPTTYTHISCKSGRELTTEATVVLVIGRVNQPFNGARYEGKKVFVVEKNDECLISHLLDGST
ncbi:hypothetical protein [Neptuniibacter sp. QD37_11]|uniref:hypothetical protein n=1 Tax=Neptuniibacter sp. QD37_11 TaxID=3398209 RepID=UPI0039F4A11A